LKSSKKKAGNTNLNSDFIPEEIQYTVYGTDKGRILQKNPERQDGPAKKYTSDEDIEFMKNSWGGAREGAGRKPTGRKKKVYYVTDEEDVQIREYLQNSEINNSKVIGRL